MKDRSGMPYDVVAFSTDEHAMMLSLEEEGAFHRLLRHAWINGSIPDDIPQLARICRCVSLNQMRKLWPALAPLWPLDPLDTSRRLNPKQESEREFRQMKSGKAAESASKRWAAQRQAKALTSGTANAMRTHNEGNASLPILSHPSPSHPDNVSPQNSGTPKIPSVPEQKSANGSKPNSENQNGKAKPDLAALWGPVEGYIRKQVVSEVFDELYAGIRIVALNANFVELAVPSALIERNGGNARETAESLTAKILESQTGLLRGRMLKVISFEKFIEKELGA